MVFFPIWYGVGWGLFFAYLLSGKDSFSGKHRFHHRAMCGLGACSFFGLMSGSGMALKSALRLLQVFVIRLLVLIFTKTITIP